MITYRKSQDGIEPRCTNINFKTPSMILIKSTLKNVFHCLFVRFYLFLRLQFILRFLIPWENSEHLYYVCQILVNAINTIVSDMEGNITIYRLPLGHGTDRATDISHPSGSGIIISNAPYHDPWTVCIYPDIALHISNYYIIIYTSISIYTLCIYIFCIYLAQYNGLFPLIGATYTYSIKT